MQRYNKEFKEEAISLSDEIGVKVSVNSSLVNKFCKTNYTCFRGEKDESIVNTIGKRNTIQGI